MIQFENKGLIDLNTIKTFGVSVKEGENPFGRFGTGFKYALAVLLRTGHKVTLWRGRTRYEASMKVRRFRGVKKEVVRIGDIDMPFTADLGKDWEPWQAFREFYCNAADEGGFTSYVTENTSRAGYTRIVVEGAGIEDAYRIRDTIMLDVKRTPLWSNGEVEVHAGASKYIFFRGVRIMTLNNPSKYTYNVLGNIDLTEDRTARYDWQIKARIGVYMQGADLPVSTFVEMIASGEDWFESEINYSNIYPVSDSFAEACRAVEHDHSRVNRSAIAAMRADRSYHADMDEIELGEKDKAMLEYAKVMLSKGMNIIVDKYPVHVVRSLGEGVIGLAENGRILLSYECFRKGDRTLIGTYYEEYLHLETGLTDCTRPMQNRVIDDLVSVLCNKG